RSAGCQYSDPPPREAHTLSLHDALPILALRPDLVRLDQAVEAPPRAPWNSSDLGKRVRFFRRFHRLTAAGSLGKPTAATAEKGRDRKSTRLNSSHLGISYAVFCLKKKSS